jgi:hypothetical protein
MGLAIQSDSMKLRDDLELRSKVCAIPASTDFELLPFMALAQHHGIPTRLLDWSNHPYIACYFAAASAISIKFCDDSDRIAVFGLDVNALPRGGSIKHVQVPGSTSLNLWSQGGSFILVNYFSHTPTDDVSLESEISDGKSYRDLRGNTVFKSGAIVLKKITLPRVMAAALLARCDKFGFSAASIFPGYNGAAQAVLEKILASKI